MFFGINKSIKNLLGWELPGRPTGSTVERTIEYDDIPADEREVLTRNFIAQNNVNPTEEQIEKLYIFIKSQLND